MTCWLKLINRSAILYTVLFLFFFLRSPLFAEIVDRVVAKVNGEIITLSSVRTRVEIISNMNKASGNPGELPTESELIKNVLNSIIEEKLQLHEAKRYGLTVSEKHEVKSSHRMKAELDTSNPANVNVDAIHKMSFRHKNITAEVEASTKIISSVNDFYTTAILNVKLGNAEYFKKKWIESIPRNYC